MGDFTRPILAAADMLFNTKQQAPQYGDLHIEGAPGLTIPVDVLNRHMLIAGSTGVGKSQMLSRIIINVLSRIKAGDGDILILTDSGGVFTKSFYKQGQALMLYPSDARSLSWDLTREIKEAEDAKLMAESLVPEIGAEDGANKQWTVYGRTLMAPAIELATHWQRAGGLKDRSVYSVLREIVLETQDPNKLLKLYAGTNATAFIGDSKILTSVRTTVSPFFEALDFIRPPQNGGQGFGIRDWLRAVVMDKTAGPRVLILPYRDKDRYLYSQLYATWLSLIATELMCIDASVKRRVWLIADEMDSLGKISALQNALAQGRKYGLVFIGALQSIAQLQKTYGNLSAQTIEATTATKVIFNPGSSVNDAEHWSKTLGEEETTKISTGQQMGQNSSMSETRTKAREKSYPIEKLRALKIGEAVVMMADRVFNYKAKGPIVLDVIAPDFVPAPTAQQRVMPSFDIISKSDDDEQPERKSRGDKQIKKNRDKKYF